MLGATMLSNQIVSAKEQVDFNLEKTHPIIKKHQALKKEHDVLEKEFKEYKKIVSKNSDAQKELDKELASKNSMEAELLDLQAKENKLTTEIQELKDKTLGKKTEKENAKKAQEEAKKKQDEEKKKQEDAKKKASQTSSNNTSTTSTTSSQPAGSVRLANGNTAGEQGLYAAQKMSELTTKEFNEIYKKYFKEYFDKPLKENGFKKKGTINFYRMNKLGLIELLNFQRHYDSMTVNFSIKPIYCGVSKSAIILGGRLGRLKYQSDYWWELKDEEEIKNSMENILEVIRNDLYKWFEKYENKDEYVEFYRNYGNWTKINEYIIKATTFARFKEYDNVLPYTAKVKEEYEKLSQEEKERQHFKDTLNEALLLEEKLKEGKESVDEYIIEREKQSLIELGLDKMFNKKQKVKK